MYEVDEATSRTKRKIGYIESSIEEGESAVFKELMRTTCERQGVTIENLSEPMDNTERLVLVVALLSAPLTDAASRLLEQARTSQTPLFVIYESQPEEAYPADLMKLLDARTGIVLPTRALTSSSASRDITERAIETLLVRVAMEEEST